MNKSQLLLSAAALFASVNGAAAQESGADPWGISDGKMLGDRAPYSTWSINPYQAADGSTKCIAGYTYDNDANGAEHDFRIQADLSRADIYMGFVPTRSVVDIVTLPSLTTDAYQTELADIYTIGAERITGIDLMRDDPEAVVSAVVATDAGFSEVSYFTDTFPRYELLDCDARAKRGEFDAAFAAYDDSIIAVIDLGADADQIKNGFMSAARNTEQTIMTRGHIEYLSHYAPASWADVFEGGDVAVGDFMERRDGLYSRSQSLTQGTLISPSEGNTERACSTANVEGEKLVIRQCLHMS